MRAHRVIKCAIKSCVNGRSFDISRMNIVIALPTV